VADITIRLFEVFIVCSSSNWNTNIAARVGFFYIAKVKGEVNIKTNLKETG
jgi:hypothetical protein